MSAPSRLVVPSSGVRLITPRVRPRTEGHDRHLAAASGPLAELHLQGSEVRAQLSLFLAPPTNEPDGVQVTYTVAAGLPDPFAADVRAGGPRLRAAFPRLARSLIGLARSGNELTAHIASRAAHEGCFFGIFRPTGREVCFDEQHTLTLHGDHVVTHRVGVDFESIARQLARR